ncbi:MAG: NAD(P)/FAD-dependent oxidoreductase [Christensenellales bacterium]
MKIAVVGAGPAGLLAAAEAAAHGAETVLLERNEKPGKKLYITGKGRCNVTNLCSPRDFLEKVVRNPKFLYGALFAFTPEDTVKLLNSNGVSTKVERGNRVFPLSDKASDVTAALVKHADRSGVRFVYENVDAIKRDEGKFIVSTRSGKNIFDKVILACGGVSYPSTGSNGDGFKLAAALGHRVTPLLPALVPIILVQDVKPLQGLSLKNVTVSVSDGKKEYSLFGEMLFTARGVSGPVALSLSSLINREELSELKMKIDLKPALSYEKLDKRMLGDFEKFKNKQFKNSLDEMLPKSMIPYIIKLSGILPEKPVNSVTKAEREKLVGLLKGLEFDISALGAVEEGIVTSGGVDVREVNPKTMESRVAPGLYFAGEMLDVDALTGGYNIQIALSTGFCAGRSAAEIYL